MTKMKSPPTFPLTITVEAMSVKCIMFLDGDRKVWLPKSQLHRTPVKGLPLPPWEKGQTYNVMIPEWLAKKEGLKL